MFFANIISLILIKLENEILFPFLYEREISGEETELSKLCNFSNIT